ncbi:MAG: hypothetical protein PHE27_07750 [Alphaproteobacteria bacterium]|nr:hypothetical protein [Alphaproteobacteria bacterium]
MKTKLWLSSLLMVLSSVSARAESECLAFAMPEITVTPVFEEPKITNAATMWELKALALNHDLTTDAPDSMATRDPGQIGTLAVLRPAVSNEASINVGPMPNRASCVQILKVHVTVGFTDTAIRIAQEIQPDSCTYQVVMGHAFRHIAMARRLLNDAAPVAKDYVKAYLSRYGAIRVENDPTGEKAKAAAIWGLNEYLKGYEQAFQKEYVQNVQKIDTQEEYFRISQSCGGETQKLLKEINVSPHFK